MDLMPNAPLLEVICEFRTAAGGAPDVTVPGVLYEKLRDVFPKKENAPGFGFTVQLTPGSAGAAPLLYPVRFRSENDLDAVQVSPFAVSCHRIPPYEGWDAYLQVVSRVWRVYSEIVDPTQVERVGLRYINRIPVPPSERAEAADYLTIAPGLPEVLAGREASDFFHRYTLNYEKPNGSLMLQAGIQAVSPTDVGVIVDLDFGFSPQDEAVTQITDVLTAAHAAVEEAFLACLSDRIRSRLEGQE